MRPSLGRPQTVQRGSSVALMSGSNGNSGVGAFLRSERPRRGSRAQGREEIPTPCPAEPAGPASPCRPGSPCGQIGSRRPDPPSSPCGPAGPCAPAGPTGPDAPAGPCTPAAPLRPLRPLRPLSFQLSGRMSGRQRPPRRILMSQRVFEPPWVSIQPKTRWAGADATPTARNARRAAPARDQRPNSHVPARIEAAFTRATGLDSRAIRSARSGASREQLIRRPANP